MEEKATYSLPLQYRIALIGPKGTGKTSICTQFVHNSFDANYDSTDTLDEYTIWFRVKNQNYLLEIEDVAGANDFRNRPAVDAYILVYSVDNLNSFESIRRQMAKVSKITRNSKLVVVVGNKVDTDHRQVTHETASQFARNYGLSLLEVAATSHESVYNLFEFVLHQLQMRLIQTKIIAPILDGHLESKSEKSQQIAKQLKQEQLRKSMSDLSWSLDRSDFSDISFVFPKENKRLYAHRCILYARSDSFRELLTAEWSQPEIIIDDVKCDIFQAIMKFVYSAQADAGDFNVPVSTAKEIIEVAEKFKIYDLSHLARRYVITKAAVERITSLLDKLFEGLRKISDFMEKATNDYVSVLAFLQENILEALDIAVTICFSFFKQYKFFPAFLKTELLEHIFRNLRNWGSTFSAVLTKLWPYFTKLTKPERVEMSELIREKLSKITQSFPDLRARLKSKMEQVFESRRLPMNKKVKTEMTEFIEMMGVVHTKLIDYDKSQMKSKVKHFLQAWDKSGRSINKLLDKFDTTEPAVLEGVKKKILEMLTLVTSNEILGMARNVVMEYQDEIKNVMDLFLKQTQLSASLQEVLDFFVGKSDDGTNVENIETLLNAMTFDNFKPQRMNGTLMEMFDQDKFSDLQLRWQEAAEAAQTINAHKVILSNFSAIFRSMFVGGFKESKEKVLPISDVDYLTIRSLVQFLYNGGDLTPLLYQKHNANDTTNLMLQVLIAANQYQIEPLKIQCEEYIKLQLSKMEVDDILSLYSIADTYQAEILKKACLSFTDRLLFTTSPSAAFLSLPADVQKSLLASKAQFERELVHAKVFVVGDRGVGKTSLINNFLANFPAEDSSPANRRFVEAHDGSAAYLEVEEVSCEAVTSQWLDANVYGAKGAIGFLFVFDLTSRKSLKSLIEVKKRVFSHYERHHSLDTSTEAHITSLFNDAIGMLVGTKCDVEDKEEKWLEFVPPYDDPLGLSPPPKVTIEYDESETEFELRRFGAPELLFIQRNLDLGLIEVSSVVGTNVPSCFRRLVLAFKQITKSFNPSHDSFNSFLNTKDSQTILIVGDEGVGKSTITKQALVVAAGSKKPNFNRFEVVQSMKREVFEYLETLVHIIITKTDFADAPYFDEDADRGSWGEEMVHVWNMPSVQYVHENRHLYGIHNYPAGLQKIGLLSKWDYVPSVEDFIATRVLSSKKTCESQVLYLNKIFRFIDLPGNSVASLIHDKKTYLDQLGIVVFMVSLADYAERCADYPSRLHRSLESMKALARELPKTTRKLFIYFNKRDEFERLLPLVKLSTSFDEPSLDERPPQEQLEYIIDTFYSVAKENAACEVSYLHGSLVRVVDATRLLITLTTFYDDPE